MSNQNIDAFMANFKFESLTFDDISLLTQYADFLPSDTDISTKFSRNIKLNIPFVSAAMDTVTEAEMAIAMAKQGGIGVIHKNLDVQTQAEEVRKVKFDLNGFIKTPITFREDQTVQEMLNYKAAHNFSFSGFPIVDGSGKLVGIITARDIKFLSSFDIPIRDVMTKPVVYANGAPSLEDAFQIMMKNKVGKLPTIDKDGKLTGLFSFTDVRTLIENMEPAYNRDAEHRLRVAAAVGPYNEDRIEALAQAGVDAFVIDTAHGHSKGVIDTVKYIKDKYTGIDVVAGNIATYEAAKALLDAGVDAVKVGIGPGSICTTRVVAGVGTPQVSAIYEAYKAIGEEVPIIADGGIKQSGDVPKAIAVGASCVMMGSVLAGTLEGPGEKTFRNGRRYVLYRGMGSLVAMQKSKGSRERYGQKDTDDVKQIVPQGVEGMVPYRGSLSEVLCQFIGGLRYSLGYCGTKTIPELRARAKVTRVSPSALKEAHPHDIIMTRDAPNYMQEN